MRQFLAAFVAELIEAINSGPGGRSALRIRPGATAIRGGSFVHINLRGGDVATLGVSERDGGRIDAWLRSPAFNALVQTAVTRAWQRAGRYVLAEITGNLRFIARASGYTVTVFAYVKN